MKIYRFTLLELMITLVVLLTIIATTLQFLKTSQNTWTLATEQQETAQGARVALDLMSRDLQSVYYGDDSNYAPFWHCKPQSSWDEYSNELIAFVAATPVKYDDTCTSGLYEIKYQLYHYGTGSEDQSLNGWLRRSITGNMTDGAVNTKWNFFNNIYGLQVSYNNAEDAFTADSSSSNTYQKLIPYVTSLTFTCYDKNGDEIPAQVPEDNTSTRYNLANDSSLTLESSWSNSYSIAYVSPPYSITISLSLLNKNAWDKWVLLLNGNTPDNEPSAAETFRKKHEKTFATAVLIGNRGQYN